MADYFYSGFKKEGGFLQRALDKAKGAITKSEYLYHGTSPDKAKSILKSGLKPDAGKGVSSLSQGIEEANKGLTFLSRDKSIAQGYANQQKALETAGKYTKVLEKVEAVAPGKAKAAVRKLRELSEVPSVQGALADNLTGLPFLGRGTVVRAKIPKNQMPKNVPNPEVTKNPSLASDKAYKHDVVLEGGVSPKYLKKV